ncbi:phospholipase B1, membrane-associated-like [Macrochelys suwanniensis]
MKLLSELFFLWLLSLKGMAAHPLMERTYLNEQKKLEPLRRFQFPCELEKLSHSPSSSVHTLRPSDIKAIAAIAILQTNPLLDCTKEMVSKL